MHIYEIYGHMVIDGKETCRGDFYVMADTLDQAMKKFEGAIRRIPDEVLELTHVEKVSINLNRHSILL